MKTLSGVNPFKKPHVSGTVTFCMDDAVMFLLSVLQEFFSDNVIQWRLGEKLTKSRRSGMKCAWIRV